MVCDNGILDPGRVFSSTPGTSCKNGTTLGTFKMFSFPTSFFSTLKIITELSDAVYLPFPFILNTHPNVVIYRREKCTCFDNPVLFCQPPLLPTL